MFHEGKEREFVEESVVWRRVLPSSYPKGSLWLEVARCLSQAKIKTDGKGGSIEGVGLKRSTVGKVRNYVRNSLNHSK